MPKANIYGPWKMEIAVHYDIWAHQLLLAVIVTKYSTGGNYKNSSNMSIHIKMNQSCDFVADKNTQTMLPHVLLYLGNTKAHAANPKYQLWLVQPKLLCLICVWEIHSNNSWKIALAQSLQASNQHVYQRQATRISLIYIWLGVVHRARSYSLLRVGDDLREESSHLTQMGAVGHANSILSQWGQQITAEHRNLNFLLW